MIYSAFYILTQWMFPDKENRKIYRTFCRKFDNDKLQETIHNKRYPKIIEKIKKESAARKIRIAFLSSENSKWAYNSLYKRLENNPNFEPFVLLTVQQNLLKNKEIDYHLKLKNNFNFFKENNINIKFAYDIEKEKYIDLKYFRPDIVFYEQPWDLPKIHRVENVSKYALCCHCSYGSSISNFDFTNETNFYRLLYIYFVDNDYSKNFLATHNLKKTKLVTAGQQKKDEYNRPLNIKNSLWKTNKPHIIYAPHFSFFENSILKFGTFNLYYDFFLNYAINHKELEFIFKPHPKLKETILDNKLMTKEETEKYFELWQNLPNSQLNESGNYFDMFRTSD
ncbi:MAG: hypothetical protein LUH05_04765, partial [Candidatus Gastranaerophilales bacterium]|nr:hypothetical protein [Candidatus Gastranaerophilales bacterium]